jgi:hypothetical protein
MGMLMKSLEQVRAAAPMSLMQAIAALEANESELMNGRLEWAAFVAERSRLERELSRSQAAANARIARVVLGVN